MRLTKHLALILGCLLFFILLYKTGIRNIYNQFSLLGWSWTYIVSPFIFVLIFDTIGWQYTLSSTSTKPVKYKTLFLVRLAGESINYITPTAHIGGEPLKAYLLQKRQGIPYSDGIASIILSKTTMAIAQLIFIIIGLLLGFYLGILKARFFLPLSLILGLLIPLVYIFILKQQKGLFMPILGLLNRLRIKINFLEKRKEGIQQLDKNIATFYQKNKRGFLLSTCYYFFGWIVGIFELMIIFKAIGLNAHLPYAFVIETLYIIIRAITFIVPGNIGVQEGGTILIFMLTGFSPTVGLSVGMIKRVRELLWTSIGLLILAKYHYE